jgi:nitrous oxidase accessory protein
MLLQSVDASEFRGNHVYDNTVGIYSENSQDNSFKGNRLEKNYIGLRLGGSSRGNFHSGNQFLHNSHQVEVNGEGLDNSWAHDGFGNRWSGATPTDLDGDGIGELPHREADLLGNLRQQFPVAGLLSGSPGLELLRFARSRGELPGVRAIEDPHPLTKDHD